MTKASLFVSTCGRVGFANYAEDNNKESGQNNINRDWLSDRTDNTYALLHVSYESKYLH